MDKRIRNLERRAKYDPSAKIRLLDERKRRNGNKNISLLPCIELTQCDGNNSDAYDGAFYKIVIVPIEYWMPYSRHKLKFRPAYTYYFDWQVTSFPVSFKLAQDTGFAQGLLRADYL